MTKRIAALLLLALALAAALPAATLPEREPDLVIAHSNDLHAHYRSFENRQGESVGGMARLAGRVAELRAEHGDRLLYLDAGDLFQGTPFYHFHRGRLGMSLLEAMGCDAMALGNHELDDGPVNLLKAAGPTTFPLLCANLDWADGSPFLAPSARLEAGGYSVDVVSLLTSLAPEIIPVVGGGELVLRDPAEALRGWMDAREDPADLSVLLSHCGLGEDREIARQVPGMDLFIGAHSHSFMDEPEIVAGTPIVQAGCHGYFLGVTKLWRREDGGWDLDFAMEAITADTPEDPKVAALIEVGASVVDREMQVVIGRLAGDFPQGNKSDGANALGQMIAEALRRAAGADLGLQNVGGYRISLYGGEITRETLFTLLPFDNKILRLSFRGAELQKVFDFLAAERGGGRFGQIAGGSYRVENGRALDVKIAGETLDPKKTYTLATLDFLAGGGDNYTVLGEAFETESTDLLARDVLEKLLGEGWTPAPEDFPANVE